MQGCDDEDHEESESDVPHLQLCIHISIMRIWHPFDKAGRFTAQRVGHEPKGSISPSHEWATLDLRLCKIPNNSPTRESRIAVKHVRQAIHNIGLYAG